MAMSEADVQKLFDDLAGGTMAWEDMNEEERREYDARIRVYDERTGETLARSPHAADPSSHRWIELVGKRTSGMNGTCTYGCRTCRAETTVPFTRIKFIDEERYEIVPPLPASGCLVQ